MSLSPEIRDLLALHLVPGIGPRLMAALLDHFGSAGRALAAGTSELTEIPHISLALAGRLQKALHQADLEQEIALLEEHQVQVLGRGFPGYPEPLENIPTPPALLFMKGTLLPRDGRAVAVVGSRHCTSYGKRVADRLGRDLAQAGYTVISGLARGIDGCAHKGALEAGGRTLAVLAGGLAKIYPPEHAGLAGEVADSGALITESAMRMEPMAGMFPARNRIISGLARAVVVVEAAEKSGALITVEHALEQGKDVFAIPGPVDSPASGGTLKMIRDGARLIRHAGDLVADLEELEPPSADFSSALPPPPGLDEVGQKIWEILGEGPRNIDELAGILGQSVTDMGRILMTLEFQRAVRRLPGSLFERYQ